MFETLDVNYSIKKIHFFWDSNSLWEFSVDPADVFLQNLSVPDLLLHVTGFARIPAEHEKSGRQSIESVNGAQVPQIVLLGEDEDNSVVTVATARMNLGNESIHNLVFFWLINVPTRFKYAETKFCSF